MLVRYNYLNVLNIRLSYIGNNVNFWDDIVAGEGTYQILSFPFASLLTSPQLTPYSYYDRPSITA